ncbi:hypothetical protein DV096_15360 [Bradymonadaceae bacterium TMQ3]|nr:hypothetical protein DV096_15360 [Bradymonadaceae bacterium TMQ3]TXC74713.1 hypothetical protein FRC91_14220 [Bradymonadales bacterium TMQ1]
MNLPHFLTTPSPLRLALALVLALLTLGACSSDDASYGFDVCEPSCPRGYYVVTDCQDHDECEHIETCDGSVLACVPILGSADTGDFNEPDADSDVCEEPPRCPTGSEEVETCPTDRFCTRVTVCGTSALCLDPLAVCEEAPSCPQGWVNDTSCDDFDPTCAELRHCDETFRCRRCDNLPSSCDEGFEPVDPDACDPEAGCEQVLTCQGYISCAPLPDACTEEPVCPEDFEPVEACTTDRPDCQLIEICDQELACAPIADPCEEPPTCPDAYIQVEGCDEDLLPGCQTLEICDVSLACAPPDACELAACPEGTSEVPEERCAAEPCTSVDDCYGTVVYCVRG